MSVARFSVMARFDRCSGFRRGTVEIDRTASIFSAREHRRRRRFELPLGDVATLVCQAIVLAEARAAHARKKGAK